MTTWGYTPTQQENYSVLIDDTYSLLLDGSQSLLSEGSVITTWTSSPRSIVASSLSSWNTIAGSWDGNVDTWNTAFSTTPHSWNYTPTASLQFGLLIDGQFHLTLDGSQSLLVEAGSNTSWTYNNRS